MAQKRKKRKKAVVDSYRSYFDLNQLELAFINRALDGEHLPTIPEFVEIGKSKRILSIQKRNLERLCTKLGRKKGSTLLKSELNKILNGEKVFVMF